MRGLQFCIAFGLVLNASQAVGSLNQNSCPLLGPAFPPPRGVDVDTFQPYADSLTVAIEDLLAGRSNPDWIVTNTSSSFSIALWTADSNESLYERHFEGSEIRGDGHEILDSDTLYRIGSISKVFPVYAWLASIGEAHLDEPITKFVPELAALDRQYAENSTSNDVDNIRWSGVTPRALASQLSGIPRDCESVLCFPPALY
jgi:CubicO group peptidase (beta-lactamase class C family)